MAVRGSSRFGPLSNPLKGQLCGCTGSARSGQLFFLFLNLRRIFGLYPKGIFVLFLDKNEQTNDGKRRKTNRNSSTAIAILLECLKKQTNDRKRTLTTLVRRGLRLYRQGLRGGGGGGRDCLWGWRGICGAWGETVSSASSRGWTMRLSRTTFAELAQSSHPASHRHPD